MNVLKIIGIVLLLIVVLKLLWTITYKLIGFFILLVLGIALVKWAFPNLLKGKDK